MIAAYYLILFASWNNAHFTYEKIPMQSLQACMTARNLVIDNSIADKAICVPTGEK